MNELVRNGPLLLAAGAAGLAGLLSFASPCVLPLVPGFLGYLGGMTPTQPGAHHQPASRWARGRLVVGTALFILGFTVVFLLMSVVISGLGLALREHQDLLLRISGVLVLGLGAVMLVQPGAGWQVRWRPAAGLASAPLLGVVFGLGFTACTGPALAAIQTLGTSIIPGEGRVVRALILGSAYSAGLGVPFLAAAVGVGWLAQASRWLRARYLLIQRTGGGLLVLLGLLMVTGMWGLATAWIQTRLVSGFETVL